LWAGGPTIRLAWYWAPEGAARYSKAHQFNALNELLQADNTIADSANVGEVTPPEYKGMGWRGAKSFKRRTIKRPYAFDVGDTPDVDGTEAHGTEAAFLCEDEGDGTFYAKIWDPPYTITQEEYDALPQCIRDSHPNPFVVELDMTACTCSSATSTATTVTIFDLTACSCSAATMTLATSAVYNLTACSCSAATMTLATSAVYNLNACSCSAAMLTVEAAIESVEIGDDVGTQGDVELADVVEIGGDVGTQGDVMILEEFGGDVGTQGDVIVSSVVEIGGDVGSQGNVIDLNDYDTGTQGDVIVADVIEFGGDDAGTQGDLDVS